MISTLGWQQGYGQRPSLELLSGRVLTGSDGTPVAFAVVLAKDSSGNMAGFGNADVEGAWAIKKLKTSPTHLQFTALGYRDTTLAIKPKWLGGETVQVYLTPAVAELERILVRDTLPPIVERGDTTIYNPAAFTTGRERKLEDVIDRLPGLTIDEDKQVSFNGKPVNEVLVEGRAFFGGNSQLALEGLPARSVARVEIIENRGGILGLFGKGDEIALNVTIRDDQKNVYFGDVSAAGGPDVNLYRGRSDVFRYNRRNNLYAILERNTTNRAPLNITQLTQLAGGKAALLGGGVEDVANLAGLITPSRFASEATASLVGVGGDFSPGKNTQVHGHGVYYAYDNLVSDNVVGTQLISDSGPPLRELTRRNRDAANRFGILSVNSKTILSPKRHLNFYLKGRTLDREAAAAEVYRSTLTDRNNQTQSATQSRSISLNGVYKTNTIKDVDQVIQIHLSGDRQNSGLQLSADDIILRGLSALGAGEATNALNQLANFAQWSAQSQYRYSRRINTNNFFKVTTEMSYSTIAFSGTNDRIDLPAQRSHVDGQRLAAVNHFTPGKLEGTAGASLQRIAWRSRDPESATERFAVLPEVSLERPFSGFGIIEASYRQHLSAAPVRDFWASPTVGGILSVERGNPAAPPTRLESWRVEYRRFAAKLRMRFHASAQGIRSIGERPIWDAGVIGVDRFNRLVTTEEPLRRFTGSLGASYDRLPTRVSFGVSYSSNFDQFSVNQRILEQGSNLFLTTATARTDIGEHLSASGKLTHVLSKFRTGEQETTTNQLELSAGIRGDRGAWEYRFDYAAQLFDRGGSLAPQYHRLLGELSYQAAGSAWRPYARFQAWPGGRRETYITQTNLFLQERNFTLFPGYVLLGLAYEF